MEHSIYHSFEDSGSIDLEQPDTCFSLNEDNPLYYDQVVSQRTEQFILDAQSKQSDLADYPTFFATPLEDTYPYQQSMQVLTQVDTDTPPLNANQPTNYVFDTSIYDGPLGMDYSYEQHSDDYHNTNPSDHEQSNNEDDTPMEVDFQTTQQLLVSDLNALPSSEKMTRANYAAFLIGKVELYKEKYMSSQAKCDMLKEKNNMLSEQISSKVEMLKLLEKKHNDDTETINKLNKKIVRYKKLLGFSSVGDNPVKRSRSDMESDTLDNGSSDHEVIKKSKLKDGSQYNCSPLVMKGPIICTQKGNRRCLAQSRHTRGRKYDVSSEIRCMKSTGSTEECFCSRFHRKLNLDPRDYIWNKNNTSFINCEKFNKLSLEKNDELYMPDDFRIHMFKESFNKKDKNYFVFKYTIEEWYDEKEKYLTMYDKKYKKLYGEYDQDDELLLDDESSAKGKRKRDKSKGKKRKRKSAKVKDGHVSKEDSVKKTSSIVVDQGESEKRRGVKKKKKRTKKSQVNKRKKDQVPTLLDISSDELDSLNNCAKPGKKKSSHGSSLDNECLTDMIMNESSETSVAQVLEEKDMLVEENNDLIIDDQVQNNGLSVESDQMNKANESDSLTHLHENNVNNSNNWYF